MDSSAAWLNELESPSEAFFPAFAARMREPEGLRDGVREAVKYLIPRVDWEGYLPQTPHGLLGLRAVFRLRPCLAEARFLRALATQLHAFALEPRNAAPRSLQAIGKGSGHWPNLEMALRNHHPSIAWGEALGVESPADEDFTRLRPFVAGDMANVGHKAVVVQHLGDLFRMLERPKATGRRLLALAAWIAATEPSDLFWNARVRKRLEGWNPRMAPGELSLDAEQRLQGAREICDLGLVAMLDAFAARQKTGVCEADLLAILTLAAAEKQLDARRDLEGKTAWNFVYLAALPDLGSLESWGQAAALINFFPTDEEEDRVKAEFLAKDPNDPPAALLDAILDAEPARAMGLALYLQQRSGDESVMRILAEAATLNDPGQNHGHQILAVSAASELLPRLPEVARGALLQALSKSLANSQGSGELGTLADRALRRG